MRISVVSGLFLVLEKKDLDVTLTQMQLTLAGRRFENIYYSSNLSKELVLPVVDKIHRLYWHMAMKNKDITVATPDITSASVSLLVVKKTGRDFLPEMMLMDKDIFLLKQAVNLAVGMDITEEEKESINVILRKVKI